MCLWQCSTDTISQPQLLSGTGKNGVWIHEFGNSNMQREYLSIHNKVIMMIPTQPHPFPIKKKKKKH